MVRSVEVLCLGVIFPLLRIIGLINPRGEYHYALGMAWPKSVFFAEEIFPTTKAEFEGHLFPVPKDTDAFLGRIYGDWRRLPSDEAILRSIHSAEYRSEILERMQ
jgi:lipopolysaccharide cholinephosphotransferase